MCLCPSFLPPPPQTCGREAAGSVSPAECGTPKIPVPAPAIPPEMKAPAWQGSTFISALSLHQFNTLKRQIAKNPLNSLRVEVLEMAPGCHKLLLPKMSPQVPGDGTDISYPAPVSLTRPPAPRLGPGGSRDPRCVSPCPLSAPHAATARPGAPAAREADTGISGKATGWGN